MTEDTGQTFSVVVNHEEQYSIWPEDREVPEGWVAVGPEGPKEECLDYIERVWTDMRPRSLRVKERNAESGQRAADAPDADLQSAIRSTLDQCEEQVEAYANGRPEMFGWFLARVLEAIGPAATDPDAVRAELSRHLPDVGSV